ncbi:hypothetical protein B5G28_04150 [Faecalibacterium sp. An77]|uniref:helix-turn-helix domain-containing protein n=1 Tax=Faecalibacterium sp. An77 TaxID=1965655 RepID=UPI000B38B620|nr:helix-turn-helix transcriptional regulator [Faecalibacterium sp. An77]OUN39682.1 hypothetical protein B5G28_04150 [Faecalibacterium sp. An77]
MKPRNNAAATIGRRIAIERHRAGLTQAELAAKVGLAPITIRQYEKGLREPRIDTLRKIAETLETNITYFLPTPAENQNYFDKVRNSLSFKEIDQLENFDLWTEEENLDLISEAVQMLNLEGQKVALERVRELVEIARYRSPGITLPVSWRIDGPEEQSIDYETVEGGSEPDGQH